MRTDRRTFLLGLASAAALSCERRDDALAKAARFLWAQQQDDGGFHSSTYGLLRSGQSLTPFVVSALLDIPESIVRPPRKSIERALEFIRRNTDAEGVLGRMDESTADYPNYATALAVTTIIKSHRTGFEQQLALMVRQLRSQQFSEANGWQRNDPAFGGWGMGGSVRQPPEPGHVDLSMTRYVLEALHDSGAGPSDEAMTRAQVYLARSQNSDGGFFFSPVNPEINKAGGKDGQMASYGTPTADGLLALRATGLNESDQRVVRAASWLRTHHLRDRVPGIESDGLRGFGVGLRFYYAAAMAHALPELEVDLEPQGSDGSFRNPEKLVKEDDPLIATTFAVSALLRQR